MFAFKDDEEEKSATQQEITPMFKEAEFETN
jgi:hypothetical protein